MEWGVSSIHHNNFKDPHNFLQIHYIFLTFVNLLALALALTSLVLVLVNLVINLTKFSLSQPRHQPEQT